MIKSLIRKIQFYIKYYKEKRKYEHYRNNTNNATSGNNTIFDNSISNTRNNENNKIFDNKEIK